MRLQGLRYGIVIWIILVSIPAWGTDDGQTTNGLSSLAFRRNALTTNKKALEILSSHALDAALFTDHGGYIAHQLHDPGARAVMAEIVGCALDASKTLEHEDKRFPGELGLCPGWGEHAPTEECQQIVTACVMARVNGLQKEIPIWLRGYQGEYPSGGPVRVATALREAPIETDPARGRRIPGFLTGSDCSPEHDCNWQQGYIGRCRSEDLIALRLDASPSDGWEMRVCAGIHGCIAPDDPLVADWPPYSWRIGEFPQAAPSNTSLLSFSCPTGPLAGGYYSVMLRNKARPDDKPPEVHTNSGIYPAPRKEVFRFLEGAFFGNLFLPDKLTRDCEVPKGNPREMTCRSLQGNEVTETCRINCDITSCRRDAGGLPYTNVHACYSIPQLEDSQNGERGAAYLNSRICDRPDANCFPEAPGPCTGDVAGSAHCTWQSATGVFTDCTIPGGSSEKFPSVTTYLNAPCDLIGEGKLCDEVRLAFGIKALEPPCGCALLYVAGGILFLGFVVVLIWLRDRKLRKIASDTSPKS